MSQTTIEKIKRILNQEFSPTTLDIIDESHLHAGHAGAQQGKGHYALSIAADALIGIPKIKAHKLIYQAVSPLFETEIHALRIKIVPS